MICITCNGLEFSNDVPTVIDLPWGHCACILQNILRSGWANKGISSPRAPVSLVKVCTETQRPVLVIEPDIFDEVP